MGEDVIDCDSLIAMLVNHLYFYFYFLSAALRDDVSNSFPWRRFDVWISSLWFFSLLYFFLPERYNHIFYWA